MTADLAPAPRARFALPAQHKGVLSHDERELVRGHVELLLSLPTAPYAEDALVRAVREWARGVPGVHVRADRWQNLILELRGRKDTGKGPVLAFSAHLDHPGFHYLGRRGGAHAAVFHGGVPSSAFAGAPVRFFDGATFAACATARVASVARDRERKLVARLEGVAGKLAPGAFGMWDLTPGHVSGTRLRGRVCDDLLGAAAVLSTLELLARERHPGLVAGILTRAEETGFVGCQGLLRSGAAARRWSVIGLECSPERATARPGLGPVIRVGDAGSVFEPELTHLLQDVAADLRAAREGFVWQRALMDGGRCESSAYNLWGVPAGGLCLALRNYHNVGPGGRIAPEVVDWTDHEGLVALMTAAARRWRRRKPGAMMKKGLDGVWNAERGRLAESARRIARATERPRRAGRKRARALRGPETT